MKTSLRLLCLLLLFLGQSLQAQIRGTIRDRASGEAVERAVVQAILEGKVRDYTMTDAQGRFTLTKAQAPCELRIRHMSYERLSLRVEDGKPLTLTLAPKQTELKSLIVEVPVIRQRGDTTTYNVSSYATKGDTSIEDAVKRMPGVKVADDGKISFMGKNIDKMTVDGLNLTGQGYAQVTRSVRHKDVARVEMLERQQEVQHLKGIVGDDKLIMNIVLKASGRNRIRGKAKLSLGGEREGLTYAGDATAMRFTRGHQIIGTVELAHRQQEVDMLSGLVYSESASHPSSISTLHPNRTEAVRTGLSEHLHLKRDFYKARLNSIHRLSSSATLRYGAGLDNREEKSLHGSDLRFFNPSGSDALVSESSISTKAKPQSYSVWAHYRDNASKYLVNNSFNYSFERNSYRESIALSRGRSLIEQHHQRGHSLSNRLALSGGSGSNLWAFDFNTDFNSYPERRLIVSDGALSQSIDGKELSGEIKAKYTRRLSNRWRIDLPLSYYVGHTRLRLDTDVAGQPHLPGSEYEGLSAQAGLETKLAYFHSDKGLRLDLTLPLQWDHGHYGLPSGNKSYGYLLFKPHLYASAELNYAWSLNGSLGVNEWRGSLLDYILRPVYSSYRSARVGSGEEPRGKMYSAQSTLNYRNALKEMYGHVSLSYTQVQSNLTSADAPVSDGANLSTHILGDNRQETLNLRLSASKFFRPIHSMVRLDLSGSHSTGELYRHDKLNRFANKQLSGGLNLSLTPRAWIELQYNIRGSLTWLSYDEGKAQSRIAGLSQRMNLKLSPTEKLRFGLKAEHLMRQTAADQYHHFVPIGLSAEYKRGNNILLVEADNLLNHRRYSYSSFNGLQERSVWYQLRGAMLRASYSFYF